MNSKESGLRELYAEDPIRADALLWGRRTDSVSRRGFLRKSGLAVMSAVLGADLVFWRNLPAGTVPAILADSKEPFVLTGKEGLTVLNDRPINAETPAHLLDDDITPANRLFVRNNGLPPARERIDPSMWQLRIDGEACERPTTFTLPEIKSRFERFTYQLTIECGGNGRSEFNPPAPGNQWTVGAVGCPEWTGVRLRDVLKSCGVKSNAVYTGYYGADTHLSGDPNRVSISRGVPIQKAFGDESLLVFLMNGEDLPLLNGYPLRIITGGWPASTCGKWVNKIVLRDRVHDGEKMNGQSYRVPKYPVAPGTSVPDKDMVIIESMPVKSLITFPKSGVSHPITDRFHCRGHAWAGDLNVSEVYVSIDFGGTWVKAELNQPPNRLAWQRWSCSLGFPRKGYYEVWSRAVDSAGRSQPMVIPDWNPRGYLNNACHRIAVQIV